MPESVNNRLFKLLCRKTLKWVSVPSWPWLQQRYRFPATVYIVPAVSLDNISSQFRCSFQVWFFLHIWRQWSLKVAHAILSEQHFFLKTLDQLLQDQQGELFITIFLAWRLRLVLQIFCTRRTCFRSKKAAFWNPVSLIMHNYGNGSHVLHSQRTKIRGSISHLFIERVISWNNQMRRTGKQLLYEIMMHLHLNRKGRPAGSGKKDWCSSEGDFFLSFNSVAKKKYCNSGHVQTWTWTCMIQWGYIMWSRRICYSYVNSCNFHAQELSRWKPYSKVAAFFGEISFQPSGPTITAQKEWWSGMMIYALVE